MWSSLLARFCTVGLAVVVGLGAVIGLVLERRIEDRAFERTVHRAEIFAQVGIQSHLGAGDLRWPISLRRLAELDRVLQAGSFRESGVVRLKLFNRHGRLVFSDDRTLLGEDASGSQHFRAAIGGNIVRELEQGTDHVGLDERTLDVDVPVSLAPNAPPAGVLEVNMAYDPVAANIREDVLTVWLLLGGGLALLFATLFRIVSQASRRLRTQALHDALTGLPNRLLLHRRAERALRGDGPCALLLIDLDRFKEVNDTLGHDYGDELLIVVAGRLRAALRRGDTLARLGGDEFAVLLPELPHRGAVAELAGRLQDELRRPFALRGIAVELAASIGVALSPDHGTDIGTLVRRADVAMYEAKRGRTGVETYSAERDRYSPDRLALLPELRRAISSDELVLHYQPKVALDSGEVIGVEALVRWQHPERGLLSPAEFVPLAERTGAVADLTRWVVDAALAQCRAWRNAGIDLPVAVNLAAANIVDLALPDAVADLLVRHDLPGDRLECEISEHTVMADPVRAIEVLGRLRGLGVRLSLDDFGTGHSSLAHLKRLPLDEVKIDRSFVAGMADDENDAVIVRSTIDLARNLGLAVVAEGVESDAIMRELAALRCDVAQGYHVSRPLPADRVAAWLSGQAVSDSGSRR